MSKPRILVVEDEFLIRMTLSEALADDGFDVAEASDAAEAMRWLDDPDGFVLMLTDIQLPGDTDGLELVDAARTRHPALPVIYMSGRRDTLGRTADTARDVFIPKPYLPSEVCAVAKRLTQAG